MVLAGTNGEGPIRATARTGVVGPTLTASGASRGEPERVEAEVGTGGPKCPGLREDVEEPRLAKAGAGAVGPGRAKLRVEVGNPKRVTSVTGREETDPTLDKPVANAELPVWTKPRGGKDDPARTTSMADKGGSGCAVPRGGVEESKLTAATAGGLEPGQVTPATGTVEAHQVGLWGGKGGPQLERSGTGAASPG